MGLLDKSLDEDRVLDVHVYPSLISDWNGTVEDIERSVAVDLARIASVLADKAVAIRVALVSDVHGLHLEEAHRHPYCVNLTADAGVGIRADEGVEPKPGVFRPIIAARFERRRCKQ